MIAHNTLVVVLGCAALGVAAGAVGCFALLRGRALLADAMGHAALPGVVAAALLGLNARGALLAMRDTGGPGAAEADELLAPHAGH